MSFPTLDPLDRRLNVRRDDLADIRLKGRVEAGRFTEGRPAHVVAPLADLRREPRPDCGLDHQLLCGEGVLVFDEENGWAWVQARYDGYVGWTSSDALEAGESRPTHVIVVPRTFVYPGPDLRFPALRSLAMGSRLELVGEAETRGTAYSLLPGREAVISRHLRPVGEVSADPVEVALQFLHTPYLWGGASGFGLDCSGLVHLAMRMCGTLVLRDSDMQAASIGEPVEPGAGYRDLRHGDLAFWRGHVGFVDRDLNLLHASGHSMQVTLEPLAEAVERIARLYQQPLGFRRPPSR